MWKNIWIYCWISTDFYKKIYACSHSKLHGHTTVCFSRYFLFWWWVKYQQMHHSFNILVLNPFRTKGHICPMFLKCSEMWLRQSRVLNFIHTDSVCYWLYVNKPGCDIYSLASLPDWQELSLEIPSINRKFDFYVKIMMWPNKKLTSVWPSYVPTKSY
jgi:hypothetical protein